MKRPNAALAYREAVLLGATPIGMVVLLYDRMVQDIHNAVAALKANDVEARSAHVNHALLILQQLQGTLDFAAGGPVAQQLDAFYSHIRGKLLEAQIRRSPDMLAQAHAIAAGSGVLGPSRDEHLSNNGGRSASLIGDGRQPCRGTALEAVEKFVDLRRCFSAGSFFPS